MFGALWVFWICGLVFIIILENFHPLLCQKFLLFLTFSSFWYSYYTCSTFCNCPIVLEYSFSFLSLHFFFAFQFGSFYWAIFMFIDYILSCVQSADEPAEAFFILLQSFWLLGFPFDSFLEYSSLCLHYPLVLICFLFFSISVLSILITVVLNPQSDYSHYTVICHLAILWK